MNWLYLKTLFFSLIAPGTVTVVVPYLLLPSPYKFMPQSWQLSHFIGLIVILSGVAIYLWCVWDFMTKGKGTPAPYDPPRFLVRGGLYQITSNPMYVGIITILTGEAIFFKSIVLLVYALILLLAFHLRVIYYEEPTLKRLFGNSFEEYCQHVHRWIPARILVTDKKS